MRSESKVDLDSLIADSLAVVREAPSRAGRIVALQTMGVKYVFFVDTGRAADIYRASALRARYSHCGIDAKPPIIALLDHPKHC